MEEVTLVATIASIIWDWPCQVEDNKATVILSFQLTTWNRAARQPGLHMLGHEAEEK